MYPLQDKVLRMIEKKGSSFYLTGGTALSRCYLHHRYSDDLDFFVNSNPKFKSETTDIISVLKNNSDWKIETSIVSDSFVRLIIYEKTNILKVDFVNDIEFHSGKLQKFDIFIKVDHWNNILSNKLCALSRMDAKDLIDILYIAYDFKFDWQNIFKDAQEKDLWVEPLSIHKIINEFPTKLLNSIKWIKKVDINKITNSIELLKKDILLGRKNSLIT